MNSQQLFIELLHRLGKYSDACVVHALLAQGCDEMEYTTSIVKMSQNLFGGRIHRRQVQQAIARLSYEGLIEVRAAGLQSHAFQNVRHRIAYRGGGGKRKVYYPERDPQPRRCLVRDKLPHARNLKRRAFYNLGKFA